MTAVALMIIDFQDAIDDPKWGRRGQPHAEANTRRLLDGWRSAGLPIIHVRHDSTNEGSPYSPDGPGHQFKRDLAPAGDEAVVGKSVNNAFIGTDLKGALDRERISKLVIADVLLENSVDATVRGAANLGFSVTLAEDAVASIDRTDRNGRKWAAEDVWALWLGVLDGEYARIMTVDRVLAGMEGAA